MTALTRTTSVGYPSALKWVHWIMAAAILTTIPLGIAMANAPEGPVQDNLFNLHRSFGALVLLLAIIRLPLRLTLGAPPPHPTLAPWQRIASNVTHHSLYVLIFLQPLLGWAGTSAFGAEIVVFGLFTLPPILPHNEAVSDVLLPIHRYTGFLMAGLVSVHIGAALMHAIILRDGVVWRMLPSREA